MGRRLRTMTVRPELPPQPRSTWRQRSWRISPRAPTRLSKFTTRTTMATSLSGSSLSSWTRSKTRQRKTRTSNKHRIWKSIFLPPSTFLCCPDDLKISYLAFNFWLQYHKRVRLLLSFAFIKCSWFTQNTKASRTALPVLVETLEKIFEIFLFCMKIFSSLILYFCSPKRKFDAG